MPLGRFHREEKKEKTERCEQIERRAESTLAAGGWRCGASWNVIEIERHVACGMMLRVGVERRCVRGACGFCVALGRSPGGWYGAGKFTENCDG